MNKIVNKNDNQKFKHGGKELVKTNTSVYHHV